MEFVGRRVEVSGALLGVAGYPVSQCLPPRREGSLGRAESAIPVGGGGVLDRKGP